MTETQIVDRIKLALRSFLPCTLDEDGTLSVTDQGREFMVEISAFDVTGASA